MVQALISLRNLHVFTSVAATGGVTRSADILYRAQSAVTRSIRDLEEQLGVALFERKARGMLLNAFGHRVLVRARRIQEELCIARMSRFDPARQGHAGHLQVLMNERRLLTFVELTEHHSLATVASLHGVSRAAVSASVRELESQLELTLFERSAKGHVPTDVGRALALRARRALSELRVIPQEIAAMQGTLAGTVTIGALPLARTVLLPQAIAALVGKHPLLHIRTIESPYEMLVAQLMAGDIDFIIGALRPAHDDDLHTDVLFSESISVMARRDHPLARKRRILDRDLASARWALSRQGSPTRELIAHSLAKKGLKTLVPVVETGDLAILRGLLLHSDMITAISPQQMRYELDNGSLVLLNYRLEYTRRDIGIITRRGNMASPGAELLSRYIRSVVSRMPPD
jgi:LysR family transcriptional regulator, regulator for genes of the gallate degradation pathway